MYSNGVYSYSNIAIEVIYSYTEHGHVATAIENEIIYLSIYL